MAVIPPSGRLDREEVEEGIALIVMQTTVSENVVGTSIFAYSGRFPAFGKAVS